MSSPNISTMAAAFGPRNQCTIFAQDESSEGCTRTFMQCAVCRMIHAASSRDCPCGLEALRREASSSATRRRAGGKGAFCQYQVDKAQGHDLSDALRSSEDLAGVADRVWNLSLIHI